MLMPRGAGVWHPGKAFVYFGRNHHLFFAAVGYLSCDIANTFKGFLSL